MTDPTADVMVPNPSFMDAYDFGGAYVPPPQPKLEDGKGGRAKYVVFVALAPSSDKIKLRDANGKFLKTREGFLKAVIEGIKLAESGYEIQQTHIGTGQYSKYKAGVKTAELRNASPALDYLHAHGIDAKPANAEEYESLFQATGDRQFEVTGDWSAYDSEAQTDVASKWEEFPPDPANPGARLPYVEKNGKRYWARLSVKRFVNALPDAK